MKSFVDKSGQSWAVELTIGIARRVFDIGQPESISKLLDDAFARFDLLWLLCEQQANQRGIDQAKFDSLLADEGAYVQANDALLGAVEDFFRRIGKESLALLMAKSREAAQRLETLATGKVSTIDSALDQTIAKAMNSVDEAIAKAGN
jgi:hypothetical protein